MATEQSTISGGGNTHTIQDEVRDLMRGVGGAAIIGVPLVYTMEMWQVATTFPATHIMILVAFGLIICIGYNFFSGFRTGTSFSQALQDATEALAIGIVLSAILMVLLGIIDAQTPLPDAFSKISVEAIPLAMGASVANTQFDGGQRKNDDSADQGDQDNPKTTQHQTLREIGTAVAGSLVFAASIAPTEEVARIAHRLSPLGLIAVATFSLALSYGMIFVADFTGSQRRQCTTGILQSPVGETLLAYAAALAVSFTAVCFFHSVRISDSPLTITALTIALGLPAAIGGAAGRLLV